MSHAMVLHGSRPSQKLALAACGLALSTLSFALVLYSASEEPFTAFRWSDFALNVVCAGAVFVLFASWAVACVQYLRSALHRSAFAKVLTCAAVLWTAINLLYLGQSIYGYVEDLRNPLLHAAR